MLDRSYLWMLVISCLAMGTAIVLSFIKYREYFVDTIIK